jgi:phosphatidylglycerol:prolipoprotein diacylglycerol transferase
MFPELFKIPGINFTVNTYGVLLAIGFLSGMMVAGKLAQEDKMERGAVLDVVLYSLLASLVGSRLLLVVTEWQSFQSDWKKNLLSLDFLRSGGVFYGGLLGAMVASVFLMRWYRLPWFRTADACAPGIALGQFFGRLGCFSAGCCWGKPTSAWCGVRFTEKAGELTGVPTGIALHPTQLYESLATLALSVFLYFLFKKRAFHGQIILAYLWGYGLIRFVIEFWRDDPRGAVWVFSTSQFIAISCSIFAMAAILILRRRVSPKGPMADAIG